MPKRPKVQAPEKREFHIVTSLEQDLAYQPKKMSDDHVMLYPDFRYSPPESANFAPSASCSP